MSTITHTTIQVTPETPAFLGTAQCKSSGTSFSYFFNGSFVYAYNPSQQCCVCLPDIDAATAVVTNDGLTDKNTAVIGDPVLSVRSQARTACINPPAGKAANDNAAHGLLPLPKINRASPVTSLNEIENWFKDSFQDKWELYRETPEFYYTVQAYLALCCDAYKQQPNPAYLEAGLQVYHSLAHYHWLHPAILHNAACLYCLSDEPAKALDCIELALSFRYPAMEALLNDNDLRVLRKTPRFVKVREQYELLKPTFQWVSLALFEAFENYSVQQPDSFVRFMRGYLLTQFTFYDIYDLNDRIDNEQNDERREYWQRLAAFNHRYLYDHMLLGCTMDLTTEEGKKNIQRFQQYRHYKALNPLVFANASDALFHNAHHWAIHNNGKFNERDAGLMSQSFQLFKEFQRHITGLDSEKHKALLSQVHRLNIAEYLTAMERARY